jgi:hypothetical protein
VLPVIAVNRRQRFTQTLKSRVTAMIRTSQVRLWPAADPTPASGRGLRSQHELAWALAQLLGPRLNQIERTTIYVTLGVGETYQTIAVLLRRALDKRILIAAELIDDIERWLRGYLGTEQEVEMRVLIDGLRSVKPRRPKVRARRASHGRTPKPPMTSADIIQRGTVTQK